MTKNLKYTALCLLVTLLAIACSKDRGETPSTPPTNTQDEINIKAGVWQVMQGASAPRRAHTYDNAAALETEAHFKCTAYNAGTLTAYIPTTTVDWISETSRWGFNNGDDHYYWPASGNLDFFGYMPATLPSYIAADPALTYTADPNVTFTCSNLPMTNAGQGSSLKEFMFGMALGQNEENAGTGVPLQFQHPFARIKLQLAASHPNVTINSITFRGIYNNGNYNHSTSPKWSTSGDAINFVLSLTGDAADFDNNPASERQIGDYYIMIPQDWAGEIEVNADCLYWGEKKNYPSLTTTVPTNWQPGYSYTYTFNISPDDLKVGTTSQFTEQW
jgi:hypothetical protein